MVDGLLTHIVQTVVKETQPALNALRKAIGLIFVFSARLLRHILANADISPATCRTLLKEVQAWDIDRDVVRGLQMERVNYGIQLFERLRTKPKGEWLEVFGIPKEKQPLNWALWVRTESSLLAENQLLLLRYDNQLVAFAHKGPPSPFSHEHEEFACVEDMEVLVAGMMVEPVGEASEVLTVVGEHVPVGGDDRFDTDFYG